MQQQCRLPAPDVNGVDPQTVNLSVRTDATLEQMKAELKAGVAMVQSQLSDRDADQPGYWDWRRRAKVALARKLALLARVKAELTARHADLLAALREVRGKFLLSGYRSALYDRYAAEHGWSRHDFTLPNNAAGGPEKRRMTECVWSND